MIGNNCIGKEKIFRIENELGINLKDIEYYAYTDDYSDFPLMRHADFPVVINSKKSTGFRNHANVSFLD